MSTYTQLLYHFVFSTLNRKNTLETTHKEILYKYIWGILNNKKCHLYRIGGMPDHLHLITHLHPTISPASFIKDIKLASSEMIKTNQLFPGFEGWQSGYGAFTSSFKEKDRLIEYVKNQVKHHSKISSRDELLELLIQYGIEFDEKYLL